jgi:hypothetical protein
MLEGRGSGTLLSSGNSMKFEKEYH